MVDRTATSWETRFAEAAEQCLESDRRAVQAILGEAKQKSLQRKATINWSDMNTDIKAYLSTKGADQWRSTFVPVMQGVISDQADQWGSNLAVGIRYDVANLWAQEWFERYTLKFAQEVTKTTGDSISELLQQGQREGWSHGTISKNLDQVFTQWKQGGQSNQDFAWLDARTPQHRRDLIARTETMRASNSGSYHIFQESGMKQKEWVSTHDGRTRSSHLAADGQQVPMDGFFNVGGYKMLHPHDSSMGAPTGEVVNCRCTFAPVMNDQAVEDLVDSWGAVKPPPPPPPPPPVEDVSSFQRIDLSKLKPADAKKLVADLKSEVWKWDPTSGRMTAGVALDDALKYKKQRELWIERTNGELRTVASIEPNAGRDNKWMYVKYFGNNDAKGDKAAVSLLKRVCADAQKRGQGVWFFNHNKDVRNWWASQGFKQSPNDVYLMQFIPQGLESVLAPAPVTKASEVCADLLSKLSALDAEKVEKEKALSLEWVQVSQEMSDMTNDRTSFTASGTWRAAAGKRKDEIEARLNDIGRRRNALGAEYLTKMQEALYVDDPITIHINAGMGYSNLKPEEKQAFEETIYSFSRMVSNVHSTSTAQGGVIVQHESGRSYASGSLVALSPKNKRRVTVHEMGHWLEHTSFSANLRAKLFLAKRTQGETAELLSKLTGNPAYDPTEVAKPDKFYDPYCGKIYQHDSTEILSMGVEEMWADPLKFARSDPEYFEEIIGILRGII